MQETPGRGEGSRGDVREADLGSSTFGVARLSPATFSYKDDADLINTPRPTPPKSVSTPQSPSGKKSSSATWYTVDVSFPHRPRCVWFSSEPNPPGAPFASNKPTHESSVLFLDACALKGQYYINTEQEVKYQFVLKQRLMIANSVCANRELSCLLDKMAWGGTLPLLPVSTVHASSYPAYTRDRPYIYSSY